MDSPQVLMDRLISQNSVFQNTGTLTLNGNAFNNGSASDNGNTLSNSGTWNVNSSSSLNNYSTISNVSGAVINVDSTSTLANNSKGVINNFGNIAVANGGALTNTGNIINNGIISMANFTNQGVYGGGGTFVGNFTNQGVVLLSDPTLTTITGNYTGNSGTLEMGIQAATNMITGSSTSGWDILLVNGSGNVNIAMETLKIDLLNNFTPSIGNVFDIIDYTG